MSDAYVDPVVVDPFAGGRDLISFFILDGVFLNTERGFFNALVKLGKSRFCLLRGRVHVNRQDLIEIVLIRFFGLVNSLVPVDVGIIITIVPGGDVVIIAAYHGVLFCAAGC